MRRYRTFVLGVGGLLGVLMVAEGQGPSSSRPGAPQSQQLPTLQLRARVIRLADQPPDKKQFRWSVAHLKVPQSSKEDQWSDWFTITEQDWGAIVKAYPNSYLRRFPVVFQLSVQPSANPMQIEVEVKDGQGRMVLSRSARLFGSRLSLLVHPDGSGGYAVATSAQYNQRYWQALGEKQEVPRLSRLLVVDRYIGGDDDDQAWEEGIGWLAQVGCSAIMVPPSAPIREILQRQGVRRTAWAVYSPPGYAFAFDPKVTPASIEQWANDLAASYRKAGFAPEEMALFAMSDEPGWYYPRMFQVVREQPAALERFRQYLREQGLQPQDLGAKTWDEVFPLGRSGARDLPARRLHYWTVRFYAWASARHFSDCVRALEKAFYPGLPVFTNWNFFAGRFYVPGPVANNADKQHPDAAMGGQDWFEFARLRGGTILWTEDWFSDAQAYQWSFYCAKLSSAARRSGLEFGGYVIPRTAGDRVGGIIQKVLCIFGHGGRAVQYFVFGPEYNFPGNCYSEKAHLLRELRQAHALLARAEPFLHAGRKPPPQVAILMPRSAQVWDCRDMEIARGISDATNTQLNRATVDYMAEVFDLYLALQHANIPVAFLDEDDLTAAGLRPYRVVYLTAPNVPREGQAALLEWVRAGGTLVTISNAASADRYDEPCSLLAEATGLREEPRPRLLVPNAATLAEVATLTLPEGKLPVYGQRGSLRDKPPRVHLRFSDDRPAFVEAPLGQGRHFHFAFLPGISYWRSSRGTQDRLPVGFSEALRQWITFPVRQAGVTPPVQTRTPLVETPLLLSDSGAAITLLNWTGAAIPELELTLTLSFRPQKLWTASGQPVQQQQTPAGLVVKLPLAHADILIAER
jgi:hypothetical protein